jgi:hypothetical protein
LTVTGLTPDTVAIGEPSFDIHVMGTGFVDGCTINFAGQDEPTTFVSDTEVTTGINMPLWLGPDAVPVFVKNPDDTASNAMDFTFTAAAPGPDAPPARSAKPEAKVEPKKDDKDAKADHKK